ncbi:hypothetical protein HYH03_007730 [Edaphochlamys debaryana]|uniref:Aminopeptidase P N-terminal domain-containing protein n=1 Tax=Edaphochlamys debaryana TaxID=47281 RepID=A0A835Y4N9_9CHLO|nr:hypothetical protein HYH03_007730 [Edaphochlamys debaryana]|eukprot:KAG2494091.1 hypothetical protein HYH03_007730 [Edaphochlamys debaryana]
MALASSSLRALGSARGADAAGWPCALPRSSAAAFASAAPHPGFASTGAVATRATARPAVSAPTAPPAISPAALAAAAADWSQQRFRVVPAAEQFRELRQKVCGEFLAGGLLYLEAGEAPPRNGSDVFHRHRSCSNFVYMTGCEQPGFAALVDAETGHFTLLVPRLPEEAAYWVGAVPSLEQLQAQYGADSVAYTDELKALLASRGGGRDVHALAGAGAERLKGVAPAGSRVTSDLLTACLDRCRAIKSDAEVACLLAANRASGAAHTDMWRACRPGLREYQLEAVFSLSSRCRGAPQAGYPPIVGSGPNAGVMHYEACDGLVAGHHLVLVDAGAEWRCYTADISRTFPASGRFEGASRDLYGAVLAAQYAALDVLAAPGEVTLQDADRASRAVLLEGLLGMGLVRREAASGSSWIEAALDLKLDRTFMPHGIGHHLGLDVHDVSDTGPVPKGPLRPGTVVTVEPGAYLIPPLLAKARADPKLAAFINLDACDALVRQGLGGVRIEDNVVLLDPASDPVVAAAVEGMADSDMGPVGGTAGTAGLYGRLYNLTMAAGVPKEMAAVEEVMLEDWRPAECMLGAPVV